MSTTTRLALNKTEAAKALGVSVKFLSKHIWPELRVVRKGRRLLVPVREIERWLERWATKVQSKSRRGVGR